MNIKESLQEQDYNYPYHYNSLIIPHNDIPYQALNKIKKFIKKIEGNDISSQEILFAKAFNPEINFFIHDITLSPLKKKYDILILRDVIEHINPLKIEKTVNNLYNSLNEEGLIFLTVPTKKAALSKKHYIH